MCYATLLVRAVPCCFALADSNCRRCGARVTRGAKWSRQGKIEQASPVRSVYSHIRCQPAPVYPLHNYQPPPGSPQDEGAQCPIAQIVGAQIKEEGR
ncbi:hypothetical protein SRHO_G00036520 [Serrasalmus rhombeus]